MNHRKPAGTAGRIRRRLRALGFWKDGRPDVLRFCLERRYLPQNLYAWLKGRVPTVEYLTRLAADLAVSPSWLLFGNAPPGGWAGAEIRQTIRPSHLQGLATAAAGARRPSGRFEETLPRDHQAPPHALRHGSRARRGPGAAARPAPWPASDGIIPRDGDPRVSQPPAAPSPPQAPPQARG